MARTRRNPPVLALGLGTVLVGALGFLAYKFLYKPKPVVNAQGVVTKAGWLPSYKTVTPGAVPRIEDLKPVYVFYPVGSKAE